MRNDSLWKIQDVIIIGLSLQIISEVQLCCLAEWQRPHSKFGVSFTVESTWTYEHDFLVVDLSILTSNDWMYTLWPAFCEWFKTPHAICQLSRRLGHLHLDIQQLYLIWCSHVCRSKKTIGTDSLRIFCFCVWRNCWASYSFIPPNSRESDESMMGTI